MLKPYSNESRKIDPYSLVLFYIKLTILNWNGSLLGVTLPKEPKNGRLKVTQYQTYLDSKKRFAIAHGIVREKIVHTRNMLSCRATIPRSTSIR